MLPKNYTSITGYIKIPTKKEFEKKTKKNDISMSKALEQLVEEYNIKEK